MKEGDVMKKENKLDMLENTEQSVIDRLSSEFPPQDVNEKELIFKMSERKFNKNINGLSYDDEQTVSGVEVYKRPVWQRVLSIAAAVAVLAGGVTGTAFALKHFRNVSDTTSDMEAEDTTRHDLKKTAPFGDISDFDYQICDYNEDTMQKVFLDNDPEHTDYCFIYEGISIDPEKYQKLADFFNEQDYTPLQAELSGFGNGSDNDTFEAADITDSNGNDIPLLIEHHDNEVRMISFMDIGDDLPDTDSYGVLIYYHFQYAENEGRLYISDEDAQGYSIDYDLFKTTIEEILGDTAEESEEVTTEPEEETTEEESMTEAETAEESDNVFFFPLDPSFMEINWVFSDTNSQQIIETSPEQRENIYNIINCSRCIFVSKADYETSDIASATPTEHITLSSRDEESLYLFDFSLVNGKTYAAFGKYDTEKPDYTDSYYLISDDTEIIKKIKDCLYK